jgi:hypothetical protein
MEGPPAHASETTEGKLFCSFIGLIVSTAIENKLGGLMRKKSWSKAFVFTELEKIRLVVAPNGQRLLNPLTKAQRLIFGAFDQTEAELKDYINKELPASL